MSIKLSFSESPVLFKSLGSLSLQISRFDLENCLFRELKFDSFGFVLVGGLGAILDRSGNMIDIFSFLYFDFLFQFHCDTLGLKMIFLELC
jgi:hypothetical protein